MDLLHFINGNRPRRLDPAAPLPTEGLVWADFLREEAADWASWAEPQVGAAIEPQHVDDSMNAAHPSFFDGTPAYDMLIFEGLGPRDEPMPLETRVISFFMFERLLVTVRPKDSVSVESAKARLLDGRVRAPGSVLLLAHLMLDTMVDRFLHIREPLAQRLTQLQDELLDPDNPADDWTALLNGRRVARRLEALCENQMETLDAWRRGTRFDWNEAEAVRVRDVEEHVERVLSFASGQERDVEAAVQLHFAAVSHRTNQIVRTLTVFSAVFLPLSFIASVFGMNFDYMPELHTRYGYLVALGGMGLLTALLLWYFRRRGYF